jgi:glucose/arabinose dehydrogenase/chitodextrinase
MAQRYFLRFMRVFLSVTTILFSFFLLGFPGETAAAPGLTAGYAFDEASGTTVTDTSGNTNTGSMSGAGLTRTTQGKYGSALSFNGASGLVTIPHSASLNLASSYTLEAWIKPTALSGYQTILIKETSSGCRYWLQTNDSKISSGFNRGGCREHASNTLAIPLNQWSHLAAVFNDAANTYTLYFNGVAVTVQTETSTPTTNTQSLVLGQTAHGERWRGLIDEVRIYNRALSHAEIQADMNTPLGNSTPDTAPPSIPTGLNAAPLSQTQINLSWNASTDNVAVAGYNVLRNTVPVATTTTPSYADTGLTANTLYTYAVRAFDAAGNNSLYSASVGASTLPVPPPDTTPPTVSISTPAANSTVSGVVTVSAVASDSSGVAGVQFLLNGANLGVEDTVAPYAISWDTTVSANTTYTLAARARDTLGNTATVTISVTVANPIPPTVHITAPLANAQVSGIVTVVADANDDIGVVGVQFFVDGIAVGLEDTTAPYGLSWDTRSVTNGAHALTARARDAGGNTTLSAPITVNVANANFFQNEILATGFNLPTSIEFLPDGRMLVVELAGTIKVLPPPYTQPDPTPFLQLTNVGSAGVQQGIYDIALDPNFLQNRFYYVFYTTRTPNRDRLSRFTANASFTGTIAGSELVLYQDPQNADAEHHGGAINFGNDGKIYFTTGEHFIAGDAQLLTSPRGKIHRINSDGTVPLDNPFYDGAGPHWDSIWALGLRNPFRAYYDPPTGRLFIGDVGGNDYSVAKEEVNVGVAGANYGWPDSEGSCPTPCTSPIYFYPHNGRDAAITGGFVYHGTQFPSSYQGNYFFADYTQNWIRRLTFGANGNVSGVFNFEPINGSVDGPYGDIVYLTEGPDGALYYVDLGYSDISGAFGVSKIRRIRYIQSNQAPIAVASANLTSGPTPLTVDFSSAGSLDPEGQPLTYLWTFGDGGTSTVANPAYTYTENGQYTVRLTVSDDANSTLAPPLFISAGDTPTATIFFPQEGSLFIAGDTISFSGDATDTTGNVLPASAFMWNIDFLHEGHVHPGIPITGSKSGSFTIPTSGHDFSGNTRYRIQLTVTDANGLQDTNAVIVYPDKVHLDFDTLPTGLTLKLDDIARTTPFVHDTLTNFIHTIEAPNQTQGQNTYGFDTWSDGGAQEHEIIVLDTDESYTASYTVTSNSLPAGLVAGWSFDEGSGTSAHDASGNGNTLTLLSGATWSSGQDSGGLAFSGSANASTADAVSLDLASSYTLTAWIHPFTLSGYRTILIKEHTNGNGGCGYWLQTVGDQISSGFNNGSLCKEHTASAHLQPGTWSHIAAVFDNSANTYQIYLNGGLLSSQSETTAPIPNNQNLTIGRTAYGENWHGLLDEVRIYNRALNAQEIQADMHTPLP